MPALFIRLPTNRNTGTATSGNESSAYSVRCATRSSGNPLARMYTTHGMPIASTTGNPSTNSARNARTTRKPSMTLLGENGLLFFGAATAPRVRQHHQRLDDQEQRSHGERTHEEPEWQLHHRGLVLEVVVDRHHRRDEQ